MRNKLAIAVSIAIFVTGILLMLWSAKGLAPDSMWKPIVASLGSFLTATIFLGFLYRVTMREHDDARFEERLLCVLDAKIDKSITKSVHYGLVGLVEPMDFESLFNSLQPGDTLWWLDTYDPQHLQWIQAMENAVERGAIFNFLVLDSKGSIAKLRATELGGRFTKSVFTSELKTFHDTLDVSRQKTEGVSGQINIVIYKDLPCAPIYIVERSGQPMRAFTGMFLGAPTGVKFPHLEWQSADGQYIVHLHEYVVNKWNANLPEPN